MAGKVNHCDGPFLIHQKAVAANGINDVAGDFAGVRNAIEDRRIESFEADWFEVRENVIEIHLEGEGHGRIKAGDNMSNNLLSVVDVLWG